MTACIEMGEEQVVLHFKPKLRLEGGNWVENGKIATLSSGLGWVGCSRWQVEVMHLSTMFLGPEIAHDGMPDSEP